MGFKIVTITTIDYSGQPSNGRAKLRIRLKDGTELIATDGWPDYPVMTLQLHSDHFPQRVIEAKRALLQQLRGEKSVRPDGVVARLPRRLAVGNPRVLVVVKYGVWPTPTETVSFDSKVVKLEAIS